MRGGRGAGKCGERTERKNKTHIVYKAAESPAGREGIKHLSCVILGLAEI